MPTGERQTTLPLVPGSVACLYTDGLVEAWIGDELLGVERLAQLIAELGEEGDARGLLERIEVVADRAPDDMAACLVRPLVGPTTKPLRVEELEVTVDTVGDAERLLAECGLATAEAATLLVAIEDTALRAGRAVLRVTGTGAERITDVRSPGVGPGVPIGEPALSSASHG
jgi:hypothetical protein